MNAPAFHLAPSLAPELFDAACREANDWRGRCQNTLARAETAVTRTLMSLAKDPARGKQVAVHQLIGQRYDTLAKLIGDHGPFAAEFGKVAATLVQMRCYDRLRVSLCHGVGEVTLDRHGRWTLILSVAAIRAGDSPDIFVARQDAAATLYQDLARTAQILSSQLANVTARMSSDPAIA